MRFGTFSYNHARPDVDEAKSFHELLAQIELSEHLGFHEAWFAEHHHADYGLLASPNLIIAALAQRTPTLRLGNLVNVLPLHDPMQLAEECAMLDILTEGRLNIGLGRGAPKDEAKHALDQNAARARFEESAQILLRAWAGETFSHHGPTWTYEDISCRPSPVQKPHPPIYYGSTSLESVSDVARRGWNLALSRQPMEFVQRSVDRYRAERAAANYPAGGGDVVLGREIYVAETDEQAWAEAGPEIIRFWQLATDNYWSYDPLTPEDLPRFTSRFPYFPGGLTLQKVEEWGTSLIGSPETVTRKARAIIDQVHPDSLMGFFSFGGLHHDQICRSMELFGTQVMPALATELASTRP